MDGLKHLDSVRWYVWRLDFGEPVVSIKGFECWIDRPMGFVDLVAGHLDLDFGLVD